MLAVGRTVLAKAGVTIKWLRGSATALPFSDATFDVVFCQQGFQFFPDRSAALSEMYRVLVRGGRLAVSIWRSIEHNPGQVALAEGLLRHIGAEAASRVHLAFSLGDSEDLRALLVGAGFRDVTIHAAAKKAQFQSAAVYVRRVVASALAGTVIQVTEDALSAVIADVSAALQSYVDDDGLSFPMEAHLTAARK
jgi:ubiquinone/menaquinone biosynthesis C-methylase UbiE